MNLSKMVIIGLAVVLAALIGYTLYVQEGPLKSTSEKYQTLENEFAKLKSASKELRENQISEIEAKTKHLESLQAEKVQLEETISRIRKERETKEAEFQKELDTLERRLAQREQELAASRNITEQLGSALEEAKAERESALADKIRLVEELRKKDDEMEQALERIIKESETIEADLRGKASNLENQLSQCDGDMQMSRQQAQELRATVDFLEGANEKLRLQSEDLNHRLLASGDQIEGLEKELAGEKAHLASALEANQVLKEKSNVQQEESVQLKKSKLKLENQLAEMEKNRQALSGRIDIQEKKEVELQRLKNALKDQLGMSREQLEALSMDAAVKEERLKSMERAFQKLSKQLEQQIREKEIQISTLEDKLKIRLLARILFASGSSGITPEGHRVLASLASELKKMQGFEISVVGHTDNKPLMSKLKQIYFDNLGLSVERAAAASRALCSMGVNPENLSATGFSMYRPVAGNETAEGRQENRRVEIILTPLR